MNNIAAQNCAEWRMRKLKHVDKCELILMHKSQEDTNRIQNEIELRWSSNLQQLYKPQSLPLMFFHHFPHNIRLYPLRMELGGNISYFVPSSPACFIWLCLDVLTMGCSRSFKPVSTQPCWPCPRSISCEHGIPNLTVCPLFHHRFLSTLLLLSHFSRVWLCATP